VSRGIEGRAYSVIWSS